MSFVIPKDTVGRTIVEARAPPATLANSRRVSMPQSRLAASPRHNCFFENVFVPKERVFMAGEF